MVTLNLDAQSVPEVLKATRAMAGLTTRAMGAKLGVAHTTVMAWEAGRSEPSVSQFIAWAYATNQPPEQLLRGLIEVVRPKGLEPLTF